VDHAVNVISRQTDHLVRLADDLLDVARISRGTMDLHRAAVELAQVADDALEATRSLVTRKHHQLHVQLPDEPIVLNGDATRLTQILTNLINNAAKYTPEGGHIALRARPEGRMLALEVSDDGVGIDPADLPRLFEAFGQSKRSLGQAEGGLGLGLALVRKLVELHEGTIEAHSEGPGRGARFTLRIPMAMQTTTHSEPQPTALAAPGETASKRILIVDDQQDVADSFELLIGALGHTVRCVYDGGQALDAAREFHPEVVLLDLSLPGMDGYEVARRLRASPDREPMKLIAMSGFGTEGILERVRQAGFDDYLLKPIDPQRLDDLLRGSPAGRTVADHRGGGRPRSGLVT
jgi:two-component system CheB/CheR fusion protein